MTKASKKTEAQIEAFSVLKNILQLGQIIYTVETHRSASGMSRSIKLMTIHKGVIVNISYWAAQLLDMKIDEKRGGVKIQGGGMDMGYHLVHLVSDRLFRDEEKERAGYALRHEWV